MNGWFGVCKMSARVEKDGHQRLTQPCHKYAFLVSVSRSVSMLLSGMATAVKLYGVDRLTDSYHRAGYQAASATVSGTNGLLLGAGPAA